MGSDRENRQTYTHTRANQLEGDAHENQIRLKQAKEGGAECNCDWHAGEPTTALAVNTTWWGNVYIHTMLKMLK